MRNWVFPILLLAATTASPAQAQFQDSYNFQKAVKDRDITKVNKFLSEPGSVIIDTRDFSSGDTALHIVVRDRDIEWTNYLLSRGARTEFRDKSGSTPLIMATRMRFHEAVRSLLRSRALVDGTNSSGETPLIVAVQQRDATLVRLLLDNGANPDKRDTLAGKSARDYAKGDARSLAILKSIEEPRAKPKAAAMTGPK